MNKLQLEQAILETIRSFWRIKAALAVYRRYSISADLQSRTVLYDGIPQYGAISSFISEETLDQALSQIAAYSSDRLAKDVFLTLITHLEEFFSQELTRLGKSPTGTFGELQNKIQQIHTIPLNLKEDLDELRERRNCLVHHASNITAKYGVAATKVFVRSGGNVVDPSTITKVEITPTYLTYSGDIMIQYSRSIP